MLVVKGQGHCGVSCVSWYLLRTCRNWTNVCAPCVCVPNSHPGLPADSDLCHRGLCVHLPVVDSCRLPSKQHPTRQLQGHQPRYRWDVQTNQPQSARLNTCTYLVWRSDITGWSNVVPLPSRRPFVWPQRPDTGGGLHRVGLSGPQEDVPHEYLWQCDQRWMWSWYRYVGPFSGRVADDSDNKLPSAGDNKWCLCRSFMSLEFMAFQLIEQKMYEQVGSAMSFIYEWI